jgi:LmbE family N-acetylglucosaminyl deacetylase
MSANLAAMATVVAFHAHPDDEALLTVPGKCAETP